MRSISDEIFHIQDGVLSALPARSMRQGLFGKTLEEALQTLLEHHPQVISGKQIDPTSDDPPRFVLLRREAAIGSWALDHLYVDQRAILTLVETKLIQNPESRREVVGQIIEYAANARIAWGQGKARQTAVEFYAQAGTDLDDSLKSEFGDDLDLESFWGLVEDNLERGRIRLLIAGDELSPQVRRMVEYPNQEIDRSSGACGGALMVHLSAITHRRRQQIAFLRFAYRLVLKGWRKHAQARV